MVVMALVVVRLTVTVRGAQPQVAMAPLLATVLLPPAQTSMAPLMVDEEAAPLAMARLAAVVWVARPLAELTAMAMASSTGPWTPLRLQLLSTQLMPMSFTPWCYTPPAPWCPRAAAEVPPLLLRS
jgi:hypothetical protein